MRSCVSVADVTWDAEEKGEGVVLYERDWRACSSQPQVVI